MLRTWWSALVVVAITSPAPAATLLVVHKGGNEMSLVDPDSGEVRQRVRTRQNVPHQLAVSRDGTRAYVTNFGRADAGRTISVVQLPGAQRGRTIELGRYRRPHGIVVAPDDRLWVTAEGAGALVRVDPWTGTVMEAHEVEQRGIHTLTLSPDGRLLVAASHISSTLTFLSLDGGSPETWPLRGSPQGLAFADGGESLWVSLTKDGDLVKLDVSTHQEVARLKDVGEFPLRIVPTPDGRLLVPCARSEELVVVDPTGPRVLERIPIAGFPSEVVVSPDGATAWVAAPRANVVYRVDLATLEVVSTFETGTEPEGLAWLEATLPAAD